MQMAVTIYDRLLISCAFSGITYLPKDIILSTSEKWHSGVTNVKMFQLDHVTFVVSRVQDVPGVPNGALVAVEGTHGAFTAMIDIDVGLSEFPEGHCKAHSGFVHVAGKAIPVVNAALEEMGVTGDDAVSYCGHSLGGALAVLLGMARTKAGHRIGYVTTLGQPRVTDQKGAAEWQKADMLLRVRNHNDPIPCVPGQPTYHHFGTQITVSPSGGCKLLLEDSDQTCELGWEEARSVSEHHLESYSKALIAASAAKLAPRDIDTSASDLMLCIARGKPEEWEWDDIDAAEAREQDE
eukprot:TRINITY_DN680_c3_g1_i1.p1 TRINITY_DN680_c3_g1~~TRINITY_DN680_c3_g1_i1.p1  ORF type:complete len:340 (+),score=70.82 TRINITY_DN680_c3_g1_i1:136-1020(+)